jgi:cobalt/nickel transport system permease protein
MKREAVKLALYAAAIVAVTAIHHPAFLGSVLAAALLLAGRDAGRVAGRSLRAIAVFNAVVTVSYAVIALRRHEFSLGYVALINSRVFILTFLTFLAARRIRLLRACAFSPTLSYLVTLALGQTMTFRRLLGDFRQAMTSRALRRPRLADFYRHAAASAGYFYLRALDDASAVTDVMRSRGFFHD